MTGSPTLNDGGGQCGAVSELVYYMVYYGRRAEFCLKQQPWKDYGSRWDFYIITPFVIIHPLKEEDRRAHLSDGNRRVKMTGYSYQ